MTRRRVTSGDGGQPPKSAAEIEDEIRRTRAELGVTLEALADQFAPRQLATKAIDLITQSVRRNELMPMDLREAIRANRFPLSLMTAGFAWLLASNFAISRTKPEDDAPSAPVRNTDGVVINRVDLHAEYASDTKERAGGWLRASFEQNPLLIGLVGLISGAAIAALLPAARREREWVDKTRDELWRKAEEVGHEAADRMRNLAEHKARAADG